MLHTYCRRNDHTEIVSFIRDKKKCSSWKEKEKAECLVTNSPLESVHIGPSVGCLSGTLREDTVTVAKSLAHNFHIGSMWLSCPSHSVAKCSELWCPESNLLRQNLTCNCEGGSANKPFPDKDTLLLCFAVSQIFITFKGRKIRIKHYVYVRKRQTGVLRTGWERKKDPPHTSC